jgi:hypothetical protein
MKYEMKKDKGDVIKKEKEEEINNEKNKPKKQGQND